MTETGDIRPDILIGATPLPSEPPLPIYNRQNIPPIPEMLPEALEHPIWAIHTLHATVREYMPHAVPTRRPATWHYTVNPVRADATSKRLYTVVIVKFKWDGEAYKVKVRICVGASGLSQYRDLYESYVGTAPLSDLRLITALVLALDLLSFELDFSQGYCQVRLPSTPSGAPVQVWPSYGIRTFSHDRRLELLSIVMALYGLPQSGFALAQAILNKLLRVGSESSCPFEFERSMAQPCIYKAVFTAAQALEYGVDRVVFWVWLHNDNLRTSTNVPGLQYQFVAWVQSEFKITGGDLWLQMSPPSVCLGITFTYGPDWVQLNMPAFVKALLKHSGSMSTRPASTPMSDPFDTTKLDCPITDADHAAALAKCNEHFPLSKVQSYNDAHALYRSSLCSVAWIGLTCGPGLACPVSILGRVMHRPPAVAFTALHRLLRYLIGRENLGVTYFKPRDFDLVSDFPTFEMCSDASFGAPDGSAQLGYLASLQGIGPISWQSFKSSRVCLSTLMSESTAASERSREVLYKRSLLSFLELLHPLPTIFGVDNIACVRMVASDARKFSQRTKHFRIDQQFVVECQEEGEISLYQLPGSMNPSDTMTKPSSITMLAAHADAPSNVPDRCLVSDSNSTELHLGGGVQRHR